MKAPHLESVRVLAKGQVVIPAALRKKIGIEPGAEYGQTDLRHQFSYADCFALACAIGHSAVLVTGNPEFKMVTHLVSIQWIR